MGRRKWELTGRGVASRQDSFKVACLYADGSDPGEREIVRI